MKTVSNATGYVDQSRAGQLVEKWGKVLDYSSAEVKPIEDQNTRLATAMLLENQEKWCLEEAMSSGGPSGVFSNYSGAVDAGQHGGAFPANTDFYATGDARLPKVLIPMIRRVQPELISNDLFGIQPMAGPVGLAFAQRFRYDGENLACTTDDHCTANAPAQDAHSYRSFGEEQGYNYLNTAHTGTESPNLTGGAFVEGQPEDNLFNFAGSDRGVAEILKNFECATNIPQMTLEIEKTAVEAGTRRLATKWSIEMEQDIKNMHGIDIDAEMVNQMSYEITAEIDRELVMRAIQVALNAGHGRGFSLWHAGSADARWMGERNRDFYAKVVIEANRIAIRNRQGGANFIVATPSVCAILEMLPEFQPMAMQSSVSTNPGTGVAKVGEVGGRFKVYRDTRTEAQYETGERDQRLEYALLGYKGAKYYDTGIVYCPYIPVMVYRTQGVNDIAPRVQLLTRYGVVDNLFGASNFYHVIIARDLHSHFTHCPLIHI